MSSGGQGGVLSVRPGRSYKGLAHACQPVDDLLQPLLAPLASLRGVGPALAGQITRAVGGERVLDLLLHMPDGYLDRSAQPLLREARAGAIATLQVEVVGSRRGRPPRPWKVIMRDRSAFGEIAYFGRRPPAAFQKGARWRSRGRWSLLRAGAAANPDRVEAADRVGEVAGLEPVWPLTAGLFPGQLRAAMGRALQAVPELGEWHDPALVRREGWPSCGRLCGRSRRRGRRRGISRGSGWRMTSCWRTRWRWLGRGSGSGAAPAADQRRGRLRAEAWSGLVTPTASQLKALPRSTPTWRRRGGCCGCCKAMWGRARRWSRCWRC